jgi:hypothetical protein
MARADVQASSLWSNTLVFQLYAMALKLRDPLTKMEMDLGGCTGIELVALLAHLSARA